jgi:hypothetical protein
MHHAAPIVAGIRASSATLTRGTVFLFARTAIT